MFVMDQDIKDVECQTIYKESVHEEQEPDILHKGKRPVILKVCMCVNL